MGNAEGQPLQLQRLFPSAFPLLHFPPWAVLINKTRLKLLGLYSETNEVGRLWQITCGAIRFQLIQIQKTSSGFSPATLSNLSSKVCRYMGDAGTAQMGHTSSSSNPPEVNLCTWASKAYVRCLWDWEREVTKQASHHGCVCINRSYLVCL